MESLPPALLNDDAALPSQQQHPPPPPLCDVASSTSSASSLEPLAPPSSAAPPPLPPPLGPSSPAAAAKNPAPPPSSSSLREASASSESDRQCKVCLLAFDGGASFTRDVRLGCGCFTHLKCISGYIKSALGDSALLKKRGGIPCPAAARGVGCVSSDAYFISRQDIVSACGLYDAAVASDRSLGFCDPLVEEDADRLSRYLLRVDATPLTEDGVSLRAPTERGTSLMATFVSVSGYATLFDDAKHGRAEQVAAALGSGLLHSNEQGRDGKVALHYAAENNRLAVVNVLLQDKYIDVNILCNEGFGSTSLHLAAERGHYEVVSALLQHPSIEPNAQPHERDLHFYSPLHLAARNGHARVVSALLQHPRIDANIIAVENVPFAPFIRPGATDGVTPLHLAAANGRLEVVTALLLHPGIGANILNSWGMTPLECAAQNGHLEIVTALLRHPGVASISSVEGALSFAAASGHLEVVTALLRHRGVGASISNAEGIPILSTGDGVSLRAGAVSSGEASAYTMAPTKKCPNCASHVSHFHKHGRHSVTCLSCSTKFCYKCLCSAAMNVNDRETEGACACGSWDTFCSYLTSASDIKMFLKLDPYPHDSRCGCPICPDCRPGREKCSTCPGSCSVCTGDFCVDRTGVRMSPAFSDSKFPDNQCVSLYGYANLFDDAKRGRANEVAAALGLGLLNVNQKTSDGRAALHIAAQNNCLAVVNVLLQDQRIDVNQPFDVDGFSGRCTNPLHLAAYSGHYEVVSALLQHPRIDPNRRRSEEVAPLHLAAKKGHVKAVSALLQHRRIDPNTPRKDGDSPLHLAARYGHAEAVSALLQHPRIDANITTVDYQNGCHRKSRHGWTPLHFAIWQNRLDVASVLLQHPSVDVNRTGVSGNGEKTWSPLHFAAEFGRAEIASAILRHPDFDVKKHIASGWSALHVAAAWGHREVVLALLKSPGFDKNMVSSGGETPLLAAVRQHRHEVVSALLELPGIAVNIVDDDKKKRTLLHLAVVATVSYSDYDPVKNLILYDSSLAWVEAFNVRCFLDAPKDTNPGRREVVSALLRHPDVDVNARDSEGWTPLHHAASLGLSEIVSLLLRHPDISVSVREKFGRSPLSLAVKNGHHAVGMKLLLSLPRHFLQSPFQRGKK